MSRFVGLLVQGVLVCRVTSTGCISDLLFYFHHLEGYGMYLSVEGFRDI